MENWTQKITQRATEYEAAQTKFIADTVGEILSRSPTFQELEDIRASLFNALPPEVALEISKKLPDEDGRYGGI